LTQEEIAKPSKTGGFAISSQYALSVVLQETETCRGNYSSLNPTIVQIYRFY